MLKGTVRIRCSILLCSLLLLAAASTALAQYPIPTGHPRIFLTDSNIGTIATRCQVGGTHRPYYDALLAFSNAAISQGSYYSNYIVCYALIYKIHRYWNQTGYQGGGFTEDTYWQAVRTGVLDPNNWAQDKSGIFSAIATDWIWEKLSAGEIAACASYYGPPDPYEPQGSTWPTGRSQTVCTHTMRSSLFVGSSADNGHAAEYQAMMNHLENTYAPAMELSGASTLGPHYENDEQWLRGFAFEAMRTVSGVDPWPLCQKYASQYGMWNVVAKSPITGYTLPQQDAWATYYGMDDPRNAVLLALRGQDAYGQSYANDWWQESQSWSTTDYRKPGLFCYVLWYDNTLPEFDPNTAPLSFRIGPGGADHVYMRSSWTDPDPILATFEAGKYFYGHQHYDAGNFQIIRKGHLGLDSGGYFTFYAENGEDYANGYYKRTIAHNVINVYDRDETFWAGWNYTVPESNDGGQHIPPSDPSYQSLLTREEFSTGEMLRYETSDSYTYCQADLSGAYNTAALMQSYGYPPYENKITAYTREFVYLRPDFFVCIDRVSTKDAALSKVWNLHVAGDPQINGAGVQLMGDATAGIWEYSGADELKVTDPSTAFDQGSMFVKTLLPKQRVMRKIGGRNRDPNGFAYWAGGIGSDGRYDPTLGTNYYWGNWGPGWQVIEDFMWATPLGWGRVEVQPAVDSVDDIFLNVMYPTDVDVTSMPPTRLVESSNVVGAEIIGERVLLFGRSEFSDLDSLSYTALSDSTARHTVANLTPGSTYRVYQDGTTYFVRRQGMPAPPGADELVTPPPVATPGGIVEFTGTGEGGAPPLLQLTNVNWTSSPNPLSFTVTWNTNIPSDSQIEYGQTPAYGSASPLQPQLVTSHSVTVTAPAVENDVAYYFRAVSRAPGGAIGHSPIRQFWADYIPGDPVTVDWR